MNPDEVRSWDLATCEEQARERLARIDEIRAEAGGSLAAVNDADVQEEVQRLHSELDMVAERKDQIRGLEAADSRSREIEADVNRRGGYTPGAVRENEGRVEVTGHWDSSRVTEGDAYQRLRDSGAFESSGRMGSISLGEVASREAVLAAELGSAGVAGLIQPTQIGLIQPPYRPLSLLDVIPSTAVDSNLVEYVQVTSQSTVSAETAEGVAKPEATYTFADASAAVKTIAAWVKGRKQTLADAPALRGFIDNDLRYDVRRRLEGQVANGNGTGENIRGILNTTGVLTAGGAGSGSKPDRVRKGITVVQLADYEPSIVVLHPNDWEDIRLARDDSGAAAGTGGYLFGPPALAGAETLWGLRVLVSQTIPEGTALVGDPRGALILVRSGVVVLVSDSDQDDFIKNRVTILGEMRAGLAVTRPDAFAEVDLATA